MAGRGTYDIPPIQKEILEHRAKRRQMLREQYLEQIESPYRHGGGHIEDISIRRYEAMRATAYEFFKPTWKNGAFFLAASIVPIIFVVYGTKKYRDYKENLMRTGQVSYRDREFKFV